MKAYRILVLLLTLFICLSLASCAGIELPPLPGSTSQPAPEPTPAPTPEPTPEPIAFAEGLIPWDCEGVQVVLQQGETALLDRLPKLRKAVLDGSENYDEILAWAEKHPEVELHYTLTLPDGTVAGSTDTSLDLSALSGKELIEAAEYFRYLPALEKIELGSEERDNAPTLDDIKAVLKNFPNMVFGYEVTRFGKTVSLADESLDFNHIFMDDGGAQVRELLECMPACNYLDMDFCHVSDEDMAAIRDDFPNVKVVWRVWFGTGYSVRTDVEKILASRPSEGGALTPYNTQSLKYCTDVKYIDIGHNPELTDISFIGYMTKLEVAIVAMCHYKDASPLANCKNLEYLEMQTTWVEDLSPLAELHNLRHLNIGWLFDCKDITPIYGLENLERFWITSLTPIPQEQVDEFCRLHPDCQVDNVLNDPTAGEWRVLETIYHPDWEVYTYEYHPRYLLLREQFGYDKNDFSFSWKDPKYYGG